MKKLIFLNQTYLDVKEAKLNKIEANEERLKIFKQSVKIFKTQMEPLWSSKAFKILEEIPPDTVLIEYDEKLHEKMWELFYKADIVSVVDSIMPKLKNDFWIIFIIYNFCRLASPHSWVIMEIYNFLWILVWNLFFIKRSLPIY